MGIFSNNPGIPRDIDYIILTAITDDGLMKKVDKAIADGFRPKGGVAIRPTGSYTQAMIRKNNNDPRLLLE